MATRDRPDPTALSPNEAVQRYLRRRSSDSTEASVYSWWYRLKLWIAWCENIGIDNVGGLSGFDLDEYYEHRSATIAPATLEGEMWTLKKLFEYLEQLEAVDDGLAKRVRIPDVDDECTMKPEDMDGFQDDDGCPDLDNDGDGIPDTDDQCKNTPEDVDGFEDKDGCPDPDNDGDGIKDAADKCPDEPEDIDGFQDDDGCPDIDNDNDGIKEGDYVEVQPFEGMMS